MTETHPEKRLIGYARVSTYGQTLDSQIGEPAAKPPNRRPPNGKPNALPNSASKGCGKRPTL